MRKEEAVPMATQNSPNLYERLGGVYSIATVVDDLIDRVMADPRLNANPLVDDAHHKVPPAGFKYLVTEMLCWAAGGPQKYTGKDMESSHRHCASRRASGTRSWTTWRRRSTSSQSRRPSGPRSWPSSRAPGARSSHESNVGTELPTRDVRSSVAAGKTFARCEVFSLRTPKPT